MRKAFTLIELLVVIAIIAILAAILFPVFAQAKEAAKKSVDLSNLKEQGTALILYSTDADDMFPQTSWESKLTTQPFNPGATYQIHWTYLLQPYIKNWDIFVSPVDSTPVMPPVATRCPNGIADLGKLNSAGQMYCDWQAPKYSYIPNYNFLPAHDWSPVSLTVFPAPADTIVLTDRRAKLTGTGYEIGQQKSLSGFNPSQPCPGSTQVAPQYGSLKGGTVFAFWTPDEAIQHDKQDADDKNDIVRLKWDRFSSGGSNYAYGDGHAKYARLAQVLDPTKYGFGDHFYPSFASYNTKPCSN